MSKRKPKTMATAAAVALEVAAFVLLAGIAVAQQRLPAGANQSPAPQALSQSASSPSAKTPDLPSPGTDGNDGGGDDVDNWPTN